jgi:hypothetical protein
MMEIVRQFAPLDGRTVLAAVADVLGIPPRELPARLAQAGGELAMLLTTDRELREHVRRLADQTSQRALGVDAYDLEAARARLARVGSTSVRRP